MNKEQKKMKNLIKLGKEAKQTLRDFANQINKKVDQNLVLLRKLNKTE